MATISEALQIAIQHHQAGRLQMAEEIYRRILAVEPDHADALRLLKLTAQEPARCDTTTGCVTRAIESSGTDVGIRNYLGNAFQSPGRAGEAVACCRRAVELELGLAEAHNNLAVALAGQGKLDAAELCCRRALELKPDLAGAHNNLGNVLRNQRKLDEAIACYRRAVQLKPDLAEAHYNLGTIFKSQGSLDEAVAAYRRVLTLEPGCAEACNDLGNALKDQGKLDEAIACYRRALELAPGLAEAHNNLGIALWEQGLPDEAVVCCRRALELKPDFPEAHSNLGVALKDQGNLGEAVASCRRALELKPDYVTANSNLVYTLHFCPDYDARTICEEHLRWNRQHAEPLAPLIRPHGNDRSPGRQLRIGYVSPDFREHPIGRFLLPLLETHDRGNFEVFGYASVRIPDSVTDRCRACVDVWRNVLSVSDEKLSSVIRDDRIDILVDLTMHMANHRLLVFARKPAPVQVTYLAYCGTTGLRTVDYRLTDPYLDPPGQDELWYSEQSVWLPETYWCYRPAMETPAVNPLPARLAGHVTFACLNNFRKVTAPTLAAWRRLLQTLPQSRLLLHAHRGSHRDRVRAFFAQEGVSPDRLRFVGMTPLLEYLCLYGQIDVALDPFPYGGGTTTCDALWMGVPVVSLAGQTAVGRGGLSILSNIGLPELVAHDPDEYVRIAAELAQDLPRLSALRATLRDRMQASPLMDAPRFARNVEAAYRDMWRRWCAK